MRRSLWLGVLTWLGVVVVASGTTWAVIDTAGRQVLAPVPEATVPATSAPAPVSRGPGSVLSPRPGHPSASRTTASAEPEVAEQPSSESDSTAVPRSPSPSGGREPGASSFTEGTWRGAAGTVIARCDGAAVRLHSATPTDSYQVEVESTGPEELEVKFTRGDGDELRVDAWCVDGAPRFEVESDSAED